MKILKNQILGGTNTDASGEKLPLELFRNFVNSSDGIRRPVHQQHDISLPVAGYLENIRLQEDGENEDEWFLVADVAYEEDMLDFVVGGFSISGAYITHKSKSEDAVVYVPDPFSTESRLISELATDDNLSIGRWIKKTADTTTSYILLLPLAIAVFQPAWEHIYKRFYAERVDALLDHCSAKLSKFGLRPEVVQYLTFNGHKTELRLSLRPELESAAFQSDDIDKAITIAGKYLLEDQKASEVGVERIVMISNQADDSFSIHRVEYSDGECVHCT